MTYSLECGHCGCGFTLEGPLARTAQCPVCGGALTVAIAVLKTEALPPLPAPLPLPKLHFPRVRPEPGDPGPARNLAAPWPTVRAWLNVVRSGTEFVRPVYGLVLGFGLLSLPFQPPARQSEAVEQLLGMLCAVLFIPAVLHACCQVVCLDVPKGYGAWIVVASVAAMGLMVSAIIGVLAATKFMAVTGAAFGLLSFGLWLMFLARLGTRLSDKDLATAVTAFGPQLSGGIAIAVPLVCCTYFGGQHGLWFMVWCGFAGGGGIGFLLLRRYTAILRVTVLAVERHAPVVR